MAWTAYGTGSAGHAQAVAIGKALKEKYGTNLRVLPGKNDVARLRPLQTGKVDAVANGAGTYSGAGRRLRLRQGRLGPDAGAYPADLQGQCRADGWCRRRHRREDPRRPQGSGRLGEERARAEPQRDSPSSPSPVSVGTTWRRSSSQASARLGTAWPPTRWMPPSRSRCRVRPSRWPPTPRGLVWPATPHGTAGWNRMLAMAPYFTKNSVKVGAAVPEGGIEGMAYPIRS